MTRSETQLQAGDIFRKNVRRKMRSLGWSQDDLAAEMGCTKGYVSQMLRGNIPNPGIETVERFALALGTSIDRLLRKSSR